MPSSRLVRRLFACLAIGSFAASCDDNPVGLAANANRPGTGTLTMRVSADIEVEDQSNGAYSTQMAVVLRTTSGAAVTGASVIITSTGLGSVTLTETPAASGNYVATRSGAPAIRIELDVTRGTDRISDVIVGFPGTFAINSPRPLQIVPGDTPLRVRWSVPRRAAEAIVETRDFESDGVPDNGSYTIPGASNPPRTDQRIRVFRISEVVPIGALPVSYLRVSVRATVEPVVVAP
jgi:hypothetical protein